PMSLTRIAAVIRRHWLGLWRGGPPPGRKVFFLALGGVLWGGPRLHVCQNASRRARAPAAAAALLLPRKAVFWSPALSPLYMTMSLAVMDETNTRNLLNVLTTSVTPGEYLTGIAAFGLMKLCLTMCTLTIVTVAIYGFSLTALGWVTLPIVLVLIISGWAIGF